MISLYSGTQAKSDHRPSSALAAGDAVQIGTTVYITSVAIAADELGAVNRPNGSALYQINKDSGDVFADDAEVFWDTVNLKAVTAAGANIVKIGRRDAANPGAGGGNGDLFVVTTHER